MISDYLQAKFWVGSGRSDLSEIAWFLVFSAILIVIGILGLLYLKFAAKENPPKRKYLVPLSWGFIFLGILGFIFGWLRAEGVSFFSAYAFWALHIASTVIWTAFFSYRLLKFLPKELSSYESYLLKQKYLPKRKKKS